MRATINSQQLAVELRLVNKVTPTNPAIAILSHVLLRATADGMLHFYATDTELGLTSSCEATVHEAGSVVLPLAKLLALVEQFVNDDVHLTLEKRAVAVTCGAFVTRLQVMSVDDFPSVPQQPPAAFSIDGVALARLVGKVRYATAATAQKHVLQGALLSVQGGTAAMVATDGKRLALTASAVDTPAEVAQRLVIPSKALDTLTSMAVGPLTLCADGRHLFFIMGTRTLSSRMLDEQRFPAYERAIPRDHDKVLHLGRQDFTAALKRITLIAEDNSAVFADLAPGKLTLSSAASGVGTAEEAIAVEYDGPALRVCINGAHTLDYLKVAENQTVKVTLKDDRGSMLLTDGPDHVGVIMLMRP